jgi:hypothetical protein
LLALMIALARCVASVCPNVSRDPGGDPRIGVAVMCVSGRRAVSGSGGSEGRMEEV